MHYWAWEPYRWPAVLFERERPPVRVGPRASIQRDMENRRKRWRTSKGVAKVNGSVGGYFSFPLDFSLETLRFESRESNSSKRVEISKRFVKKLEREEKCQVVKQRLSLKSISREHRENRTIVKTSYYMLQYATTRGSTITSSLGTEWLHEESRYCYWKWRIIASEERQSSCQLFHENDLYLADKGN